MKKFYSEFNYSLAYTLLAIILSISMYTELNLNTTLSILCTIIVCFVVNLNINRYLDKNNKKTKLKSWSLSFIIFILFLVLLRNSILVYKFNDLKLIYSFNFTSSVTQKSNTLIYWLNKSILIQLPLIISIFLNLIKSNEIQV